jgi:hypothetical protein
MLCVMIDRLVIELSKVDRVDKIRGHFLEYLQVVVELISVLFLRLRSLLGLSIDLIQ